MSSITSQNYGWRLAALCLAMLLPSLGISIANVALPSLKVAFEATNQDVQWVVIAYLVTLTSSLVAAGRLGDLLGRRRLLIAGIVVFALAGAGGLLASQLWMLVIARSMQGFAAAIMMSLTVAMVGEIVPKDRTGSAMGLLGTVSAIGTTLGPSLGGLLIAALGWPGIFVAMTIAAVAALALAYRQLPPDHPTSARRVEFDLPGALLLASSICAFALAMTIAASAFVVTLLLGLSTTSLLAFVVVEMKSVSPLVRLDLLKDRRISVGLIAIGFASAIIMTTLVVGPFYLSTVLGLGPLMTGLVMSIGPAVSALVGVPAGRLVDRFGSAIVIWIGLTGVMLGASSMALLAPSLGIVGYGASLAIITSGYALFQAANNTAVMTSVGNEERGVISALLALARNLGLVVGASAMGALFALGVKGLPAMNLQPGGEAGLRIVFLSAAVLAMLAIIAWRWARPAT